MTIARPALPAPARGYSLVELATVLSVVGILTSLGLTSFGNMLLTTRRSVAVNDLLLTLHFARNEAVKRGRNLVVCGVRDLDGDHVLEPAEHACTGIDWSFGWMLAEWHDADGNASAAPGELTPLRVFQSSAAGITVRAGHFANSPSVSPPGTILVKAFTRRASNGTVTFCDRRGAREARAVIVSSAGRARVSARRADGSPLTCP